jgi:hypothetical protein
MFEYDDVFKNKLPPKESEIVYITTNPEVYHKEIFNRFAEELSDKKYQGGKLIHGRRLRESDKNH